MKFIRVLPLLLLCALVAFGAARLAGTSGGPAVAAKETAYARVMRTGTLRCGYMIWPPAMMKNANTGEISGFFHDYVEELGKALQLKVEWALELDMASYIQDLNDGKYDLECSGGWPNALRGKLLYYTRPIAYLPYYLYVREGDTRFDGNLALIDDPKVRFAGMDGEFSSFIHDKQFPNSVKDALSSNVPYANLFMDVWSGKADVTGRDALSGKIYQDMNPGHIRRIPSAPVKVLSLDLSMARGEADLQNMLNVATEELLNDGSVGRILDRYQIKEDELLRVPAPSAKP